MIDTTGVRSQTHCLVGLHCYMGCVCVFQGDPEDRLGSSLCSGNQVEAEVIVHSELNDLEKERQEARSDKDEDSQATRGPSFSEAAYSPVRQPAQAPLHPKGTQHPGEPVRQPAQAPHLLEEPVRQPAQAPQHPGKPVSQAAQAPQLLSPGEESLQTQPLPKVPSGPVLEPVSNHNGQPEGIVGGMVSVAAQLTVDVGRHLEMGLTNGFHSTKPLRPRQETLGNGDSRHCPPPPAPSPFVSAGLVHSNSAVHSYLCP